MYVVKDKHGWYWDGSAWNEKSERKRFRSTSEAFISAKGAMRKAPSAKVIPDEEEKPRRRRD